MKRKGNTRQIDGLGRIVIPKDFRNTLGISDFDYLELFMEDDKIIVKKQGKECVFCGTSEGLSAFNGKHICAACKKALAEPPATKTAE